jgi:hypothetical protein
MYAAMDVQAKEAKHGLVDIPETSEKHKSFSAATIRMKKRKGDDWACVVLTS